MLNLARISCSTRSQCDGNREAIAFSGGRDVLAIGFSAASCIWRWQTGGTFGGWQYRVLGHAVKFRQMTTEAADVESAVAISSISTSSVVELR
jgi:hypothetical protein